MTITTEVPDAMKIPRIVLMEDDWAVSSLFQDLIYDWFKTIELVPFADGDEAWLELSRTKPDLLILDWKHPGLPGHEILQKLVLDQSTFPVLLTSILFAEHVQRFSDQGLILLCYASNRFFC